ncbi:glycosyl hydrolase 53 domain-containing protein [Planoprotostelium fungivorum]|uniref:Glycosyl hydrolase 53 domain-containing protein n=1 Tax=Planoprotostelium fungivorum TaxID=1890364 RepID=A0A2P6MVI5_9EUKA|nr:glycosyl hydrolase 53 domain-containing protein [Planoprotostelium fungivorum]
MRASVLLICTVFALVAASGKRGLGIGSPFNASTDFKPFQATKAVSWYYNWSLKPLQPAPKCIEFVPMQYNGNGIENLEKTLLALKANRVLGFNEPDQPASVGGTSMDAQTACNLWMKYFVPLKTKYGIKLGLPAVSAGGLSWLNNFLIACPNHKADFLPIHWYGAPFWGVYDFLWSFHGNHPNIPVWVTEWAINDVTDYPTMANGLSSTATYFDGLDWIERYAWFGSYRANQNWANAELSATGALTAVGSTYVNTPFNNTITLSKTVCPSSSPIVVNGPYSHLFFVLRSQQAGSHRQSWLPFRKNLPRGCQQ